MAAERMMAKAYNDTGSKYNELEDGERQREREIKAREGEREREKYREGWKEDGEAQAGITRR